MKIAVTDERGKRDDLSPAILKVLEGFEIELEYDEPVKYPVSYRVELKICGAVRPGVRPYDTHTVWARFYTTARGFLALSDQQSLGLALLDWAKASNEWDAVDDISMTVHQITRLIDAEPIWSSEW